MVKKLFFGLYYFPTNFKFLKYLKILKTFLTFLKWLVPFVFRSDGQLAIFPKISIILSLSSKSLSKSTIILL